MDVPLRGCCDKDMILCMINDHTCAIHTMDND